MCEMRMHHQKCEKIACDRPFLIFQAQARKSWNGGRNS